MDCHREELDEGVVWLPVCFKQFRYILTSWKPFLSIDLLSWPLLSLKCAWKQGRSHLGDEAWTVVVGAVCSPSSASLGSWIQSKLVEHLLYVMDCAEEAVVKETGGSSPPESLWFHGECSGGRQGERKTQRINKNLQPCVWLYVSAYPLLAMLWWGEHKMFWEHPRDL